MKYLFIFLALASFNAFGCGNENNIVEKEAFASVRGFGDSSVVDIYFPAMVEGAEFAGANVRYEKDDKSMFSIPVATHDPSKYETAKEYKGMLATNIASKTSELTNFILLVNYRPPVGEDGAMAMCGPEREYKVSDLVRGKL